MKYWTAHLRPGDPSVLIREGFSWGAALFGPIWLLLHQAWVPGLIVLAVAVLIEVLAPDALAPALFGLYGFTLGLYGNDLLRFAAERRGYALAHVLAARNEDAALARLLAARPELAHGIAGDISPGLGWRA